MPLVEVLKINTDANLVQGDIYTIGGCIRDYKGLLQIDFSSVVHANSVKEAEAQALVVGMDVYKSEHYTLDKIIIEMDFEPLMTQINEGKCGSNLIRNIWDYIKDCRKAHTCQHIYKEGNVVADAFAHLKVPTFTIFRSCSSIPCHIKSLILLDQ
jgi:hypothetical protein